MVHDATGAQDHPVHGQQGLDRDGGSTRSTGRTVAPGLNPARGAAELIVLVSPTEAGLRHRLRLVVRDLPRAVLVSLHVPPPLQAQVGITRASATDGHLAELTWLGPGLSADDVGLLIGWLHRGGPPVTVPSALEPRIRRERPWRRGLDPGPGEAGA